MSAPGGGGFCLCPGGGCAHLWSQGVCVCVCIPTCNGVDPPCEQNHRHVAKHNLAPTSLRAVKICRETPIFFLRLKFFFYFQIKFFPIRPNFPNFFCNILKFSHWKNFSRFPCYPVQVRTLYFLFLLKFTYGDHQTVPQRA